MKCIVVVQSLSCVWLCDPMDWNLPGFPVLHYLLQFAHPHAHCHPTISSFVARFSSSPQSFPASGSFPMTWLFESGGQSIGPSASASVLPVNIQRWLPLGLAGLMSLLSKRLSRVFSNTPVQKYQFFSTQLSIWSNSHNRYMTTGEKKHHSFDYTDLCQQSYWIYLNPWINYHTERNFIGD